MTATTGEGADAPVDTYFAFQPSDIIRPRKAVSATLRAPVAPRFAPLATSKGRILRGLAAWKMGPAAPITQDQVPHQAAIGQLAKHLEPRLEVGTQRARIVAGDIRHNAIEAARQLLAKIAVQGRRKAPAAMALRHTELATENVVQGRQRHAAERLAVGGGNQTRQQRVILARLALHDQRVANDAGTLLGDDRGTGALHLFEVTELVLGSNESFPLALGGLEEAPEIGLLQGFDAEQLGLLGHALDDDGHRKRPGTTRRNLTRAARNIIRP